MSVGAVKDAPAPVTVGDRPLTVDDVIEIAQHGACCELSSEPALRARLERGPAILAERLADGGRIYGVTTGYGDSVTTEISDEDIDRLSHILVQYHGCGVGPPLSVEHSLAVVLVRAATFVAGWSGVRPELVEGLLALVHNRIAPVIPAQGSVGASGDLTPLSYVAAALIGEREVFYEGRRMPAAEALAACGLRPLRLAPKEGLALINGTAVMAALACFSLRRARHLAHLACLVTAMVSDATLGNPAHFDERIFDAKPHRGCRDAGRLVRRALHGCHRPAELPRLQDRYSVRCAPHVIGVLLDVLPWCEQVVEVEINGANDNPLIDPVSGDLLHGGNFYGGHLVAALDQLKVAVANVGDLLERQLLLLCQPQTSHGLPANLSGAGGAHHGFKGAQITASALVAEALKLSLPASVFSRSTENHNQDKVSMGTLAARECLGVVELVGLTAAIVSTAAAQGAELRGLDACGDGCRSFTDWLRERVAFLNEDRELDRDIELVARLLTEQALGEPANWSFGAGASL
jgi:histidine ammonia-lyase